MTSAPCCVHLAGPADVAGFRQAARRLLAQGIAPDAVQWVADDEGIAGDSAGLFDAAAGAPSADGAALASAAPVSVPRSFVELTEAAALHAQPQRHALLYRLLWRLQHEPSLRHDPLDPDWLHAEQLAREVRRELHKTHAYVRFRPLERGPGRPPLHVAWFEPEHHTVEAAAPFFVRRFTNLEWRLLTPRRSAAWDGERLALGPGASRADAPPADAGEALWLTYYEHIFNPARLKLAAMQREMPRRYWNNLPEAVLIAPLAADAHQRSSNMIDKAPTAPRRRRTVSGSESVDAGGGRKTIGTATAEGASATVGPLPAPDPAAPSDARRAALQTTQDAARGCTGCPLYAHATQTVFGAGPIDAALMFVGEQPGDQEDLRGAPFVGPAGQLFDRALAELQVDRGQVYVTNAVKHFKFEMRGTRRLHKSPGQQEAAACLDWLEREIALVQPNAIVALGATAARSLMGRPVPVMRERGQWLVRPDGVRVLITLHPSALLRMQPEERAAAYRDWLADLALATKPAA